MRNHDEPTVHLNLDAEFYLWAQWQARQQNTPIETWITEWCQRNYLRELYGANTETVDVRG